MLKLRILLLRNNLYYLMLFIALVYLFISLMFVPNKSIYGNLNDFAGIVTKINVDGKNITFYIKNKEVIIAKISLEEVRNININLGDKVYIQGKEKTINRNTTPNTFNYKKYLNDHKIFHVLEIEKISVVKNNKNILYKFKNFLIKKGSKLTKSLPYIEALLFGNSKIIDDDVMTTYRNNGISHLLAISGLHIGLFVKLLESLLKKFKIKENTRYILIILFLIFYIFLTNFTMSVVRAGIFTILLMINKIYYFYIKTINLMIITLVLIIFINPRLIFDLGLQYSYTISFFLILFQDVLKNKKFFISLFITSLIAFFVSLPITINNFYQVNVLSIIYNLFFVPFLSYMVLPLTIVSYFVPFLDKILFFFLSIMEYASVLVDKLGSFRLVFMKPCILVIALFYLLIFLYYFSKKNVCLFLILLFCVIWYIYPIFNNKNLFMMFDVKQGDSSLFVYDGNVTLIDTGGYISYEGNYTSPYAKNIIIPYLKSKGIKQIDNLILTHGDQDHMQDSIYLINNFNVKNIYINCNKLNELESELYSIAINKNIKLRKLYQNDKINMGNIDFVSLNKCYSDENDSSVVLYANINNYKFLLGGDISKKIERRIVDEYNLSTIHILKVAHHGSKTSSDYKFLEKISPYLALISVGEDNKFGHPSDATINNFNNLNIKYLQTNKIGSIEFDLKNGTFKAYPP